MMKSTSDYLKDKDIDVILGLYFTCKDYDFLVNNNFKKITINSDTTSKYGIPLEEILTKKDIVNRVLDLYNMCKLDNEKIKLSHLDFEEIENNILIPEFGNILNRKNKLKRILDVSKK